MVEHYPKILAGEEKATTVSMASVAGFWCWGLGDSVFGRLLVKGVRNLFLMVGAER